MYAHSLTADNATMSLVDLGDMGGMLHSTSYVEGASLVTQLRDQETNNHTITSTRTRTEGESFASNCAPSDVKRESPSPQDRT